MSEPDHPEPAPTPKTPPEGAPEMTRSERLFLRISVWQTVLSVAGVFTGAVALYAALTESSAVRRQTAAAVWPYVQLAVNDYLSDESGIYELTLTNSGVGPAQIRAVRVSINGSAMSSWAAVIDEVSPGESPTFSQSFIANRVIRAGESVTMFGTQNPELVAQMREVAADSNNSIQFCYCSIFDECWTVDSRTPNAEREPQRQCPSYGEEAFQH